MTHVVAVRWVAKEGEADEVARALGELLEPSLAEPGILEYRAHRDG
ncbi:MAG: putative quinol monooxygenase, partial [Actinomycetota bacterium]